jgi:hypothetical protein
MYYYIKCRYAECRHAECCHAEGRRANVIMLSVIMPNVVKLSVVKLNVVVLNVMAPLEQIYLLDSRHVEVCDSFISEKERNGLITNNKLFRTNGTAHLKKCKQSFEHQCSLLLRDI